MFWATVISLIAIVVARKIGFPAGYAGFIGCYTWIAILLDRSFSEWLFLLIVIGVVRFIIYCIESDGCR